MSQSTQPEQPLQKGQSPAADAVGPPFATGTSEGSPTANAAERATGTGAAGAVHPSEVAADVLMPAVGLEPTGAAHPSEAVAGMVAASVDQDGAPDSGAANAAGPSPAAGAAGLPVAIGASEGEFAANAAERATGAGEVGAVHPSEAAAGVLVPAVGLEPTDAAHPSKAAPDTGAANAAGQSPAANAAEPPPASPATVTPQPAQSAPLAQTTPPPPPDQFSRTARLFGCAAVDRLRASRVAVFGLGGVGSYAAEALARAGVGALTLVDADVVTLSNLNRQLVALHSTVGQPKALVMAARVRDICPDTVVTPLVTFFDEQSAPAFDFSGFDYVVDAIDSVDAKVQLIVCAKAAGTPIVSSMGTGNKLDAAALTVANLSETSVCPLARVMRRRLRERGILSLRVVYSKEQPQSPPRDERGGHAPASAPYVPPVAGMLLAGEVIRDLTEAR